MPFFRREPIRPVFVTPPAEQLPCCPSAEILRRVERLAKRSWELEAAGARRLEVLAAWEDVRLAIHPPREEPVLPQPDHDVYAEDIR